VIGPVEIGNVVGEAVSAGMVISKFATQTQVPKTSEASFVDLYYEPYVYALRNQVRKRIAICENFA
jgi:hypothetical protein